MKWILPVYVILACLSCFIGIMRTNVTDKNGNFKTNWGMIIGLLMLIVSPIVAKISGVI